MDNYKKGAVILDSTQITQTIISTINTLFGNMVSSIDNGLYAILDDIIFINTDILESSNFKDIFGTSPSNGILLITNAFLFGFVLYYAFNLLFSHISYNKVQSPAQFVLKLIVLGIFMNCSFFLCEQIISLTSLFSNAICSLGEDLFNCDISFSSLITRLNTIIYIEQSNINLFSIDGIIKSIISAGFLTLIFSYSIRYVLLKIFLLLSPFAILCLCTPSTSIFFKTWLKSIISLLLIQVFVSIILVIIFSLSFNSNDNFSKFILIGSILVLTKANSYVRELFGGISTDLQNGLYGIQSLLKH